MTSNTLPVKPVCRNKWSYDRMRAEMSSLNALTHFLPPTPTASPGLAGRVSRACHQFGGAWLCPAGGLPAEMPLPAPFRRSASAPRGGSDPAAPGSA